MAVRGEHRAACEKERFDSETQVNMSGRGRDGGCQCEHVYCIPGSLPSGGGEGNRPLSGEFKPWMKALVVSLEAGIEALLLTVCLP